MRVIAGSARSLLLKTPAGMTTRPTTDRIKETLFNILQQDVPGAVFVDLCAGSGQIGIEALSRGAKKAYFIENDAAAIKCIEENLKHTKLINDSVVLKQDAVTAMSYGIREKADVIFADPPYGMGTDATLLSAAVSSKAVTPDTIIIIEEKNDRDFPLQKTWVLILSRRKFIKPISMYFCGKE